MGGAYRKGRAPAPRPGRPAATDPAVGNPAPVAPGAGRAPSPHAVPPRRSERATFHRPEGAHRGGRQAEVVRPA
ncbi:hypothetical protein E5Z02_06110 [Streptomyces rhizosphaericola]|uniref:Uncharacterized protein n=1 Tax=Streptomyces rhizosphaericola TaxID=2564098 RepID=A0ABY2PKZ2_9ACTN|nr:hypothetical protein E5Z02_06110 [Streptomyces rhizosphaericola]